MRQFVMMCVVFLLSMIGASHAGPSTERPNILFIMSDDHATNAISCYDLFEDPQELNNVYNESRYAATVTQLKQDLLKLKTDLGDQDEAYPELMALRKEHW